MVFFTLLLLLRSATTYNVYVCVSGWVGVCVSGWLAELMRACEGMGAVEAVRWWGRVIVFKPYKALRATSFLKSVL